MIGMKLHPASTAEPDREVLRVSLVVKEKILDDLSFVAKAKNEFLVSIAGVIFHDVPQNGITPDWNHWLRYIVRDVPDSGSKATAKNDDLQDLPSHMPAI